MNTTTKWSLDPAHSEVQFKVRHLMISNVNGSFRKFTSTVETEGMDFNKAKITFKIDASSIDTNEPNRDAHLRSDDFFNSEKHPEITFVSTQIKPIDNENMFLIGNLTIRDITKEVKLHVAVNGMMVDPYGNTKAGFEVTGKINRKEYGVKFGAITETGALLLGDEVSFTCNIQYAMQVEKPAEVTA